MTRKEALKKIEPLDINPDYHLFENIINEIFDDLEGSLEERKHGPWAWVKTEYCAAFKAKNSERGGYIKESITRMKKMFAAMPEMRKEDVMGTVKLYLSQTNSKYIRYPHYFLKKGVGNSAVYEFANWYDKYLETKDAGTGRTSSSNTMQ